MFTFAPKKKTKERAKKDSLLPRPYFSPCPHMLLDHVDTIELRICFGCREMRFFLPDGTTSKAFKARKAAFEYLAAYYGERDRDATFWEIFEAIETSGFPIGATQREIAGIE